MLADALQKGQRQITALLNGQHPLAAVRLVKTLTVEGHGISNGVPGNKIRHPVRLLQHLLLRNGGGEEVYADEHTMLGSLLHIVPGVAVSHDLALVRGAVTHPDHGKVNAIRSHLGPIDGTLIAGHIDTNRRTIGLILPLGDGGLLRLGICGGQFRLPICGGRCSRFRLRSGLAACGRPRGLGRLLRAAGTGQKNYGQNHKDGHRAGADGHHFLLLVHITPPAPAPQAGIGGRHFQKKQ